MQENPCSQMRHRKREVRIRGKEGGEFSPPKNGGYPLMGGEIGNRNLKER